MVGEASIIYDPKAADGPWFVWLGVYTDDTQDFRVDTISSDHESQGDALTFVSNAIRNLPLVDCTIHVNPLAQSAYHTVAA